ncbi:amidase family protein [Merdibacter massiliensis]|uniref:amidase family protein n=1 Tax=Merdibacter massiliensis TaxID=1871030 RepID=UPI00096A6C35|nr:amidase family protein [Merdibacter massiliensis]
MRLCDYEKQGIRERCEQALEKLRTLQPQLNAVVTFCDIDEQLEALKDRDPKGKLYGMPIVLKDNVSTKGIRTTASSRILDNYVPVYDANIVERLKEQGAIIIAKASMDELGMGGTNKNAYTGKVNNPYDLKRISGGSSGGSAVLVAAGGVAVAIGTDTGDSVRKPAAYNGIIGVKPTYGRISRYGIIPYASSLDHVGYFTTNVEDACTMLEVLAGRDDRDMTSSYREVEAYREHLNSDLKGKVIGILDSVQDTIKEERIKTNVEELCAKLAARGAQIRHVQMPQELMETILPVYLTIANAEATANHSNLDGIRFGMREDGESVEEVMKHSRTKGFSAYVRKRFIIGSYSLFVENQDKLFRKAQKIRRLIVDHYRALFEECDCIIASAAPTIAPYEDEAMDEALGLERLVADNHMQLGNFSGYPSMTLPSGSIDGMPIGVNITCRPFEEQTMFNIGKAIEEETGLADHTVEVKA